MDFLYRIDGMHCGACVQKVKQTLGRFAEAVTVTFNPPEARLTAEDLPALDDLNHALAADGYRLSPIENLVPPAANTNIAEDRRGLAAYYPLLLIVGYLAVIAAAGHGPGGFNWHDWTMHFMAGFFLTFSFFKLLNLRAFADAYASYDLLAARWRGYGYVYPFLELGLGFAYLFGISLTATLWLTVILMGFSALGVIKALFDKKRLRCACLGTVLNVPLSTVTLIEDLGMAGMAAAMLLVA